MSETSVIKSTPTHIEPELKGWLFKWTNYLKGYQKRWFVLSNGLLSYYRNPAEMAHTCRGTISLHGALFYTVDACTFVISNGGTQTFHIKASTEVERNKWVTALELAKNKSIRAMESDEDDANMNSDASRDDINEVIRSLGTHLDNLQTCSSLIDKHWQALQRSLTEFEQSEDLQLQNKVVSERATLFRIASNAMINACADYLSVAKTQSVKWTKLLEREREQRIQLEEMIEQLARQESYDKEQASAQKSGTTSDANDEDGDADDNEFFDCLDNNLGERASLKDENTFILKIPMSNRVTKRHESEGSSSETDDHTNTKAVLIKASKESNDVNKKDVQARQVESISENKVDSLCVKKRRTNIPPKPNCPLNLWSVLKNCIGRDISKIPMPVNFSEPLSMLQRITEDYEYSDLLDRAAKCTDVCEQLAYVAAFSVSSYASTAVRTNKPFNPLLGETYECDRRADMGWRAVSEQVSHQPPMLALHCESQSWTCWQEFTMTAKFKGKYLQIVPTGIACVEFNDTKNKFTWCKVNTTIHNIIVGKIWVDQYGDMEIIGHGSAAGIKCHLKYIPHSYFTKEAQRRVKGCVMDHDGKVKFVINGIWDSKVDIAPVTGNSGTDERPVFETGPYTTIWKAKTIPPEAESIYYFSEFACQLNEPEDGVAPTDSRNRLDQRLMEEGKWDEANAVKQQLEEQQRVTRRKRELEAEEAASCGNPVPTYEPTWFKQQEDKDTGSVVHMYSGKYWESKSKQDWSKCPDIF